MGKNDIQVFVYLLKKNRCMFIKYYVMCMCKGMWSYFICFKYNYDIKIC